MAEKTPNEIVVEYLPDMEVVETSPPAAADSVRRATRPGPTMAELRRKYLGPDAEEEEVAPAADAFPEDEADVEVKQVRAKQTPADPAEDPGPRAVIVSKKKGIIGAQG
jgi:hypothetical protein